MLLGSLFNEGTAAEVETSNDLIMSDNSQGMLETAPVG
jgi:hypothetical protein